MLAELAIRDLVLIASARLELAPGLNVISGETGAGKSLLAQAIGLLMGQKADAELVRPGAERAVVEALFEDDGGTLAVAREVPAGGRSRVRLDGLLSSVPAVEEALRRRVAFYGQLEHTRLLQLERQVDLLDGAEAMAAVRKRKPDLILLDLQMPVMDGYEVIEAIKTDPDLKDIPIVIMTAYQIDRSRIDILGMAEQKVDKPFSAEELVRRVEALLAAEEAGQ